MLNNRSPCLHLFAWHETTLPLVEIFFVASCITCRACNAHGASEEVPSWEYTGIVISLVCCTMRSSPCVWIGNHTGMVGKIHELLTRLSRHVNIHGFITYQLTGCSEGWRRGYAVVQGSILHIFKSTLHVVGSPVLSWELFCSTCSPSSAAQHCLSIRKMSDLSLERKTKINEGGTSSFKELLTCTSFVVTLCGNESPIARLAQVDITPK